MALPDSEGTTLLGYCHLVVEQVGGWVSSSIAREPVRHLAHAARRDAGNSCCCGRPRSSSASRGDVSVRWYVPCEVWGLERACTCGAGVVYSRCAASTCGLSVESSLLTTHGDGSLPLDDACGGRSTALCMGATIAIIAHSVHYGSYRRSLEYRLDRKRVNDNGGAP